MVQSQDTLQEPVFNLKLTLTQTNEILLALAELPIKQALKTFNEIKRQSAAQLEPKLKTAISKTEDKEPDQEQVKPEGPLKVV